GLSAGPAFLPVLPIGQFPIWGGWVKASRMGGNASRYSPLGGAEKAPELARLTLWLLAALAALFLVWPVWRAFLPMEIWGNEGWNAYHADEAMRGAGLYPPPDGLVANNYPPLSYYLLGWLGRVFGDPLYVGRALSLLATLGTGA